MKEQRQNQSRSGLRTSVADDLWAPTHSKGQQTQIEIVEAAIKIFASAGMDKTTPEKIANVAGVSRTLVIHYFPEMDTLFELSMRYIRGHFQKLAVEAILREKTLAAQLRAYVEVTFEWLRQYPEHVKAWLLFYYQCGLKQKYKNMNSDLVDQGHDRITLLLGEKSKSAQAKVIQNLITGALLCAVTERESSRLLGLKKNTVDSCLKLAEMA